MDYYSKADRVINSLICKGKNQFIIYPFGKLGMQVKEILNQKYGIEEKYIVDNNLSKISQNKKIIDLNTLKKVNTEGMIFLLSTDKESIYSEVRCQLLEIVSLDKIIDVYSHSAYFDSNIFNDYRMDFSDFRTAALSAAAQEIYYHHVAGAIAECGVYKGDFSKLMSRFMPDRKLYLFDTFEGFFDEDITDQEMQNPWIIREENFKDTSIKTVLSNIGNHVETIVKKGRFPETAKGLEKEKFAFVSLDTDLYTPILAGLEFFYPRMNPGGYIFVHDYQTGLLGVRKAVEEFCKKENIGIVCLPDNFGTAVLSKPL